MHKRFKVEDYVGISWKRLSLAKAAFAFLMLRLNTPLYFSAEEEKDLVYYLDHELEYYFVLESEGKIAGCGEFNFSGNLSVKLDTSY